MTTTPHEAEMRRLQRLKAERPDQFARLPAVKHMALGYFTAAEIWRRRCSW